MRVLRLLLVVMLVALVLAIGGLGYVKATGLRGQPEPGPMETRVARAVRSVAIPAAARSRPNGVPDSPEAVSAGLEHFARYCALCHANDGTGQKTPFGPGLFPKPPDMRGDATQQLTDGELFYIIENGVRFTGMPAFGTGEPSEAGDRLAWQLVRFIRHLPKITADETAQMEGLNPL